MPTISRFHGIVMRMYYQQSEHNPPHVHAQYGGMAAEFEIKTGRVLDGHLPAKQFTMIEDWIHLHQEELLQIWETQVFQKIAPLD